MLWGKRNNEYDRVSCRTEYDTEQHGTQTHITNLRYFIETESGRSIRRDDYNSAAALMALFAEFDDLTVLSECEDAIPTEVAVDGMPAITTYLVGVHCLSKEEAAERIGVRNETVDKYLTRFRPHTSQ